MTRVSGTAVSTGTRPARRSWLRPAGLLPLLSLAAVAAMLLWCCTPPAPARPNIILLVNDAWRWDSLGCDLPGCPDTPNIDAFARRATVFLDASAQSPKTINSSASMFCSVYPSEHGYGHYGLRISSRLTTIAELLRDGGYETVGFSANPHVSKRNGLAQGFGRFSGCVYWKDSPTCDQINAEFLNWIDGKRGKPFFAMLWYIDTHAPYSPPPRHMKMFVPPRDRNLVTEKTRRPRNSLPFSPRERGITRALYAAEVHYFDAAFQRLIHALKKRGELDHSVLILTSDHGESFWEPKGPGGKAVVGHGNYLHDEEIHIPMIVRLPRQESGQKLRVPVQHLDLLPTIADLAGVNWNPLKDQVRGRSLAPLLLPGRGRFSPPPFLLSENITCRESGDRVVMRGIRKGRYKLILRSMPGRDGGEPARTWRRELFDLAAGEARLPVDEPEYADVVADLMRSLRQWRSGIDLTRYPATAIRPGKNPADPAMLQRLKTLGYLN